MLERAPISQAALIGFEELAFTIQRPRRERSSHSSLSRGGESWVHVVKVAVVPKLAVPGREELIARTLRTTIRTALWCRPRLLLVLSLFLGTVHERFLAIYTGYGNVSTGVWSSLAGRVGRVR